VAVCCVSTPGLSEGGVLHWHRPAATEHPQVHVVSSLRAEGTMTPAFRQRFDAIYSSADPGRATRPPAT